MTACVNYDFLHESMLRVAFAIFFFFPFLQVPRPGLLNTQDFLAGAVPARPRVRVHVAQHRQRFPRRVVINVFFCFLKPTRRFRRFSFFRLFLAACRVYVHWYKR